MYGSVENLRHKREEIQARINFLSASRFELQEALAKTDRDGADCNAQLRLIDEMIRETEENTKAPAEGSSAETPGVLVLVRQPEEGGEPIE